MVLTHNRSNMDNQLQYINDENHLLPILGQFGLFLEEDYERLINDSIIPFNFSSNSRKTNRKIVIIGSDNTPLLVSKSVFAALQLSGASSLDVKPSSLDEALIVENIIKNNNINNMRATVHIGTDPEVELSSPWREVIDEATDIIVFGDYQIVEYYKTLGNKTRKIYTHENKISFGITRSSSITDSLIDNMSLDFFNFYGFGSLSPKFYVSIGEIDLEVLERISDVYSSVYGEKIEEFRSKLNFVQKTNLSKLIVQNKMFHYINTTRNIGTLELNNLFGDIKILVVNSMEDVDKLIDVLSESISTIAVDPLDEETISMVESNMPPRICNIGSMHALDFWESVDSLSDFDIYNNY